MSNLPGGAPWCKLARLSIYGVVGCVMACAPSLDWREVRPLGSGLTVMFPCKPTSQERQLNLLGHIEVMVLHACQAADITWALAQMDVGDPTRVGPVMAELRAAAQAKMGAPTQAWSALPTTLRATPNDQSGQARFAAVGPQDRPLQMHQALFAHGTLVFQASVLGASIPAEGQANFMDSLRLSK
jgi:hypothetical protein